jgi:hypothetical protein
VLKVSVNVQKWLSNSTFERVTEAAVKSYVRDIYQGAVNRSPVETGSYRASWRIGFGAPDGSTTTGGLPGLPLPRPPFYWPKGYKVGEIVFVSNNKPYAQSLERGHSKQAPMGVLALAVASASVRL